MYVIGRILAHITNVMTIIGGLAIALMMFHITADVAGRYFFNSPIPGTITIVSYYYMVTAAFIPLAFAEQKDAHISVEVVTERLPQWIQDHMMRLSLLCSGIVFGLLALRSYEEAGRKYAMGASVVQGNSDISIWITYYILPLGCALMVLVLLYKLLVSIFGLENSLDQERAKADELPPET